ncbi:cupin domain-containing protein [Achromobacter insolitus]|uniref:cupin domain-containing protein n=1 Tax=Achromobacter insolitus TaxID=217204 RepID=UPI0013E29280|nr:cupin domain-containing protein [Achromobacter insolitus]MDH3063400.1 cupin domain-containing protein [Achromobacter insolitus]NGT15807.1 cupin domain-containing protein [Achromobacter insolitus]
MTASTSAASLIRRLDLLPHPEGGYYRETYRAADLVTRGDGARRSASTAIYYLLCDGAWSTWHRIRSDELWHFHAGGPLYIHVLAPDGGYGCLRLGDALQDADAVFQAVVPAGSWFAAELADPDGYALAGCTVAPGFEFSEFELADATELQRLYPAQAGLIVRLAR